MAEGASTAIRSLAQGAVPKVSAVTLLGTGPVPFKQTSRGLVIDLLEKKPCDYTQCFRVQSRSRRVCAPARCGRAPVGASARPQVRPRTRGLIRRNDM